jgi:CHAT domain-containing protein/Tfp pilus assembly protein PilF
MNFRLLHLVLILTGLMFPAALCAQNQTGSIHVTMAVAPIAPDGKRAMEGQAFEIQSAELHPPSGPNDSNAIIAAVFERHIGKESAFRLKIDNRTEKEWSFLVVELSSDASCNSVVPFMKFSEQGFIRDGDVPVALLAPKTTKESEWLREDVPGVQKFAVLASPDESKLRTVFMSVEFLAGLATGRAEPKAAALGELKLGEPKAKSEAFRDYRAGNQRITITLGNVYSESGDALYSAEYYDALILIAGCRYQYKKGSLPFDALRVGWLNNRGLAHYQTGDLGQAKDDYEAALKLLDQLDAADQNKRTHERLVTLTNLAQVYATLGDQKKAIANYRAAEELSKQINPTLVEQSMVAVYGGLGTSLEFDGKFPEALTNYEKAYQITQRYQMDSSAGIVLNSLGRLAAVSGKRIEAEKYFKDAITISERTQNQAGVGSASNNLGWFYVQDKRYADAHAAFVRSSEIFSDLGNRTAQATALGNLMFVEQLQGHPEAAVFFGKRAIRLLQSVRGGLTGIEKQLQRSFLMSREETYRSLADILVSKDRLIEAQAILELLKDEEYGGRSRVRSGEISEVAPYTEQEDRIQEKVDELAFLRKTRAELQAERIRDGAAFTKQAELDSVDKSIALVNAAFRKSLERLATTETSVSERVKNILGERNLQSVLSTLKKDHATEAVAVYTVIGTEEVRDAAGQAVKDRSRAKFGWAILVTPTDRKAYPIDVSGLEETVRRFRQTLADDRFDPKPDAKKLYDAVFRQSSARLRSTLEKDIDSALAASENKTVMWSLDGVLRYIPIAALNDGNTYLVQKYRNVVFTPQSITRLESTNNPAWKVLGLGVSEAREGFAPLEGAKEELAFIVRPGMFDGEILLNEKFKKEDTLRVWRDKQFPVIHIASHFKFHPTKPEESYLLLGDGELKIADIQNEDNLFDGVDLLALSACDTAMSSNGKESESFAYVAQDLGAKTILASLWPVSDVGTPELMTRFYTLRSKNPTMTKGEAFHRAQLSLVRGEKIEASGVTKPTNGGTTGQGTRAEEFAAGVRANLPPYVKDPRRPFAHPFYWAPFVLIGNWR